MKRHDVNASVWGTLSAAALFFGSVSAASAALSFATGGTVTSVGIEQFNSNVDSVTITGDFVGNGSINSSLNIPSGRVQYDIITSSQAAMVSWTLNYDPSIAADIIGAGTPTGYVDSAGTSVNQGGQAYGTLFNAGFGVYSYNTGDPWTITYGPSSITFSTIPGTTAPTLPPGAGVGYLLPTYNLPSFEVDFNPSLNVGIVPASASIGGTSFTGTVLGPVPIPEPTSLALVLLTPALTRRRRHC